MKNAGPIWNEHLREGTGTVLAIRLRERFCASYFVLALCAEFPLIGPI
jgi:hypothetical protein